MVLELAAESVRKKCEMRSSVLVGNYEFYYAAGRLASACERSGAPALEADESTAPEAMKEAVMSALSTFSPADEKEAYLARLLERYRPGEKFDEKTGRLFLMGKNE